MAGIPVALTMYTLREEAARDYMGASRLALEMGYAGLQTHYRACDPTQLRELGGDLARVCAGCMCPSIRCAASGRRGEFALELGCRKHLPYCTRIPARRVRPRRRCADGRWAGSAPARIRLTYINTRSSSSLRSLDGSSAVRRVTRCWCRRSGRLLASPRRKGPGGLHPPLRRTAAAAAHQGYGTGRGAVLRGDRRGNPGLAVHLRRRRGCRGGVGDRRAGRLPPPAARKRPAEPPKPEENGACLSLEGAI